MFFMHPTQSSFSTQSNFSRNLAVFIFLLIIIFSIFGGSLHYPFFSVDDSAYVTNNGDIRRINTEMLSRWFTRDYALLYTPITIASLAIDYQFWHLDPMGYRLTNLSLHLFNSFLVYLIVLQLTGNWLMALGVGCVFAIHPIQVESVVWISERKNLLSAFFFLLAFCSYISGRIRGTIVLFILGVLSKPNIVTFPLLLFFYNYWRPSQYSKKQKWLAVIGSALGAFIIASITLKNHAATEIYFRGGSFLSNLYVMMTIFFKYIQLLIFPFCQQFFYMSKVYFSFWNLPVISAFAGMCLSVVWLAREIKKKSQISFWLVWYLTFLIPVSNVVTPIGTLMNDRYLYIPMIGFFAVVFLFIKQTSKNFFFDDRSRKNALLTTGILALLLIPFGVLSYERVHDWHLSASVLETDMSHAEYRDVRMNTGKVTSLLVVGDVGAAIKEMDAAIKISPTKDIFLWQIQNYLEAKKPDDAAKLLETVSKIPNHAQEDIIQDFYGQYYFQKGKMRDAEEAFQNAIKLNVRKVIYYVHLAVTYQNMQRTVDTITTLEQALGVDPDSLVVLTQLCNIYLEGRDYPEAYSIYLQLVKLYPNEPFVQKISNQIKTHLSK